MSYRAVLLPLLFCACTPSQPPSSAEAKTAEPSAEGPAQVVVQDPPPPPMPEDAVIELRRTRCYGTCPAYSVTIDAQGHVRWEGEDFVRKEGKHTWDVAPEALEPLWQALVAVPWARLPRETATGDCPELWTDNPSLELVVRGEGETHAVKHYLGCRGNPDYDALEPLAKQVDVVAETAVAVGPRR